MAADSHDDDDADNADSAEEERVGFVAGYEFGDSTEDRGHVGDGHGEGQAGVRIVVDFRKDVLAMDCSEDRRKSDSPPGDNDARKSSLFRKATKVAERCGRDLDAAVVVIALQAIFDDMLGGLLDKEFYKGLSGQSLRVWWKSGIISTRSMILMGCSGKTYIDNRVKDLNGLVDELLDTREGPPEELLDGCEERHLHRVSSASRILQIKLQTSGTGLGKQLSGSNGNERETKALDERDSFSSRLFKR